MGCRIGRAFAVLCAAAALSGFLAFAGSAQDNYPSQGVKFVVAFAAGGPTDAIARIFSQRLTEKWGHGVVVENRGGAGGNIAARQVAKAEPNGYTVLVTTSAFAVNPTLSANPGYAPETDYKTVVVAGTTPNVIVANPGLKASNLKELVALAKAEKMTYGMPGAGTTPHLSAEKFFKVLAKVDVPAVPFTGAAPLLNALVGGHVGVACLALPPTIELIKTGQLKALAVISDKRIPSLPDVPTAQEQGFGEGEEFDLDRVFRAGRHAPRRACQAQLGDQCGARRAGDPRAPRPARRDPGRRLAGDVGDLRAGRDQEVGRRGARARDEGRVGFVLCCVRACDRSATRSSACSMPIDRRIVVSPTPMRARTSAGTPECVVVPGWQASDSVPPRLTASLKICSRLRQANASASPPLMSKEKVEPGALHCAS